MLHRFLFGPDDPAFAHVLRIYHASFDRASREPDERLVAELRGEYRLPFRFLIAEDERAVIAFARFCRLPTAAFGFLIHIAVDEARRGSGVGAGLLEAVRQAVAPEPLLVEIERAGRVHDWYGRQGFRLVSDRYTQPALHSDTSPVPFALYASSDVADRTACVEAFYKDVWELGPDHPFVRQALRI